MEDVAVNSKPITDVINNCVIDNIYYQTMGVDVAIPYIIGAPGGGKTASISTLTDQQSWGLLSTHFALKPIEESGGIPQFENITINNEEVLATKWSFPDIMKNLYIMAEQHEIVVWLLDDMHLAGSIHLALLYELLTERKLREFKLPDNVAIVMAGNHGSSKAGAKTQFSAIVNRCVFFPIYSDFQQWKINFAIPNNVHNAIISFLENDQYNGFFHEEEQVDTPWGSPRAWTRFSNTLKCMEQRNNNSTVKTDWLLYGCAGHVSKEAASAFSTYYQIFMKFNIKDIFTKIDKYTLPENPVDKYALAFASINYFIDGDNYKKYLTEFCKLVIKYNQNHPDLSLMIMHSVLEYESALNKRNILKNMLVELHKIEPGSTTKLIAELKEV